VSLESLAQKKERAIKNLQNFMGRMNFGCRKTYIIGGKKTEFTFEEILKEIENETEIGKIFIEIWAIDIETEKEKARKAISSSH
jgi:hypothetical protein